MKTAQLKLISVLVPYVAVIIGLYVLKNAWVAIGLYHFGLIAFLIFGDILAVMIIYWLNAASKILNIPPGCSVC